MVRRDSENCHLNLSLSAVCDYCISWSYSLTIFDVFAFGSVKQNLPGKECSKLYELCHEAVIMICLFLFVLWVGLQCVIVAVPGHTHLLFKLTFSLQFLQMVRQEQHNFL